jgi:phenylalanyl-tRNA synthetase beta subunit
MVDRIFQILNIPQVHSRAETKSKNDSVTNVDVKNGFYIDDKSLAETYFEGRRADVVYEGEIVGSFGVIHPEVLEKFEIGFPCTAFELNIEPFL